MELIVTKQVLFHHSHEDADQSVAPKIALNATVSIYHAT